MQKALQNAVSSRPKPLKTAPNGGQSGGKTRQRCPVWAVDPRLTFAPGETEKTITIEVKGDNKGEADEVFYLDLYHASGTLLFAKSRGVGRIVNDD